MPLPSEIIDFIHLLHRFYAFITQISGLSIAISLTLFFGNSTGKKKKYILFNLCSVISLIYYSVPADIILYKKAHQMPLECMKIHENRLVTHSLKGVYSSVYCLSYEVRTATLRRSRERSLPARRAAGPGTRG